MVSWKSAVLLFSNEQREDEENWRKKNVNSIEIALKGRSTINIFMNLKTQH